MSLNKIDSYVTSVNSTYASLNKARVGIETDSVELKAALDKLQSSPGQVNPEDQSLIDTAQRLANSIVEKVKALDIATPLAVPITLPMEGNVGGIDATQQTFETENDARDAFNRRQGMRHHGVR